MNARTRSVLSPALLCAALALPALSVSAQDHAGHTAPPAKPAPKTDAGRSRPAPAPVDHSAMGHEPPANGKDRVVDHGAMGHTPSASEATPEMDHSKMGHEATSDVPADGPPRTPIPPVTDADRLAAFPPAHGHAAHDRRIESYWLADRLEWQDTEEGSLGWEGLAWIGGDVNRVWLRTEGEAADGDVEAANAELLYGRAISRWWDAVVGARHDFGAGPSRTYAAFGFQGLAPYKFEVEATAFVGSGSRGGATVDAEYETLFTNRLILQWQGEANFYVRDDREIGVGSGLSTLELGARLRYEFNRHFAPYIGIEHDRAFGETADLREEDGEATRDTYLVAGVRFWF